MRRTWSISLAAAALGLLALPLTASAAPPGNDNFASASMITGVPAQLTNQTNAEATMESGEPNFGGDGGASVWYTWTAPSSGLVQIHTCNGQALDTILAVYTVSGISPPDSGSLNPVAANDDFCGLNSLVQFNAINGTSYKIQVLGFDNGGGPDTGLFTIRVSNQIPVVTIDSGPGFTTSSNPTWAFHSSIGGSQFECAIFAEPSDTLLVDQLCSSPYTSPLSLAPGSYEFDVAAASPTFEYGFNFRTFTVESPPSQPPATGTGITGLRAAALKKCKKKHSRRARRRCKRRANALPLSHLQVLARNGIG